MNKLSVFALSFFMIGVSVAQADWTGNWQGTFNTVDSKGDTAGTVGFTLGLQSTATTITFTESAGLTALSGLVFDYSGTTLTLNGHTVGTYSAGQLAFTLLDDIDGEFATVAVTLNADGSLALTYNLADYQGDFINGSSSLAVVAPSVRATHTEQSLLDIFKALRN